MREIQLPPGTEWVLVDKVPGLLAAAQYPPVPEGRAVSYLLKKLGDGSELPLQEEDESALASAWEGLPPYAGAAESEWPRYAAAYAAIPRNKRPRWQPVPVWRNGALNAGVLRADAEDLHRQELRRAVLMGEVQVLNHAGLPTTWGHHARMSVDVFRGYAGRVGVEVLGTAPVDRGRKLKRAALVDQYRRRWSTLERDLKDASSNGLANAAKAPEQGYWWEEPALEWARQRNKLAEAAPSTAGIIHRLRG